jgi:hypothetical protein
MTTGFTDAIPVQPIDEPQASVPSPVETEPPATPEVTLPPAPKPSRWKELVVTVLLAALVGAVVAGGFIVGVEAALGRFARGRQVGDGQSGNLEAKLSGDLLTQKGKVTVPASGTVEVFYPAGYVNPPALTWKTENRDYFRVSDQTSTGFKVKSNINQAWDFYWEATGVADKGGAESKKTREGKK